MIDSLKYYLSSMYAKGYAVLAVWFSVFRELFAKYIFNDWDFVGFLFVAIILDTFFGTWKVAKLAGIGCLSLREAEKFLVKIFLYFGVLTLSHILGNFTIHGKINTYYTWIDSFLYSYMMGKEGFSVAKNINAISPAYVPQFVINRLNRFLKSGRLTDLFKDENEK